MDIDRDALFAALALRFGQIDPNRLASAYEARSHAKGSLADLLVSRGDLSPEARDTLQQRLDALIRDHAHEPHRIWLAVADDQVRTAMTDLSLPPFQATIDSTGPCPEAEGNGSADFRMDETIDSKAGGGLVASTIDSAEVAAVSDRFVGLEPLRTRSGEYSGGRYTRTELHAQGGLGEIWRARDVILGREVALKELKPDSVRHPMLWDRFIAEAKITGQLEHPNIVPVHELGRHPEDGRPYYTMRFVRGRTLAQAIADYHSGPNTDRAASAMGLRRLLDTFLDVCNAVAFAHAHGVIHRDLKGQNVVLGDYGEALVLDWGLARPANGVEPIATDSAPAPDQLNQGPSPIAFDPARSETQAGQILGTPAYMPPEQARGEIGALGPTSDIYSLGAILFEMLTGRPPHVGKDSTELLRMARDGAPPAPRSLNSSVPKPLEAICQKALSRSPAGRYPSVPELAEDIRRWLADEPVSVYREPLPVRAGRWARRHRTPVAVAAALMLAALPALTITAALINQERDRAAAMESLARTAVDDMYLEVADTILGDLSDPRQEAFLRRALAGLEGGSDAAEEGPEIVAGLRVPPIDDALRRSISEALAFYQGFVRDGGIGPSAWLDRAKARVRIGDISARLGRFDEAEASYRQAITTFMAWAPQHRGDAEHRRVLAEARANLGDLLGALGQVEEAEQLIRQAILAGQSQLVDGLTLDETDTLAMATAEAELAELLKLSGRFEEAEETYRSAIDRLRSMTDRAEAPVAARRELAGAADGLAVLLLLLDRPDEAEPLLRQALEIQRPLLAELPTVPRIREGLAKTGNSLGILLRRRGDLDGAEEALRPSISHYERLAEDFPGRVEYRRALARGHLNLGVLLASSGQLDDAEASYRRAVELYENLSAEAPEALKIGRDRVLALVNLGTALELKGDEEEARGSYSRAITAAEALVDRFPKVPDATDALGSALLNRGRLLDILGEFDEAESDLKRAASIFEELAEEHPDRPSYRQEQAASLATIGPVLAGSGADDQAEDAYRKAIATFDSLLEERPDSRSLRGDLASALANLGSLKRPDAEESIRRSLAILGGLAEGQEPTPPSVAQQLGMVHYNLAERLADAGRLEEAEVEYAKSAEILVALADEPKAGANLHYMASVASLDLSRMILDRGDFEAARAPLEQAVSHASQAAGSMNVRTFRETLDQAVGRLVETLLAGGDYGEAARVAAELATALPDRPELRVRAAELLGECITSLIADPDLDPSRSELLAADLGQRALAQLRVAIDSGVSRDLIRDRADSFGPLRDREEFASMLSPPVDLDSTPTPD